MRRASGHSPGAVPWNRSQRLIQRTFRLIVTVWSRHGKSGIVRAVKGLSRQNSPAPESKAEPGPNSASVGTPDKAPEMRNACIRNDQQLGALEKMPHLRKRQRCRRSAEMLRRDRSRRAGVLRPARAEHDA